MNDAYVDRTKLNYSSPFQGTSTYAGAEEWNGTGDSDFFTAETESDPVIGVFVNSNEVWVPGTKTLQVYTADAAFVFAPVFSLGLGSCAPMSFVAVDERFGFLDHKRRFVISNGRGFDILSGPIQRTLDEFESVSDFWGYRVELGPIDMLNWCSEDNGVTFAFQKTAGWAQWMGWDGEQWTACPINAYYRRPSDGRILVGTLDGYLGELSFDAATDLGDTIRAFVSSGYQSHDTNKLKHCSNVRISLRRGGDVSAAGTVILSYQDRDGPKQIAQEISTGVGDDTEIVVNTYSLGTYTHRQWFVEFSGSAPFVLVSAIEEYEILEV